MKTPKISVIMATYNAERFIVEAIESVINQTFKEWELIIINDASTDKTLEIAKDYEKKDNRIKLINLKKNKGPAAARNEGLKIAKGKYIAILDSDDIALPKRLEIQCSYLKKYKDVWIASSSMQIIDKNKKVLAEERVDEPTEIMVKDILNTFLPFHSSIMFRKGLFYRNKLKQVEDMDLFCRAIKQNKKMLAIPEVLGKYRLHKNAITSMKFNQQNKYIRLVKAYAKEREKGARDKYNLLNTISNNKRLDTDKNFQKRRDILQDRKKYIFYTRKYKSSSAYENNQMKLFRKIISNGIKSDGLKAWKKEIPYYFISYTPKETKEKIKKVLEKKAINQLINNLGKVKNTIKHFKDNIAQTIKNTKNLMKYGCTDPFNQVDIETITYCNRRCNYCPNSIYDKSLRKNKKLLDEKLFYKIIDELAEIKYCGIINPNFYGEPLLDKRLLKFIRYAKSELPESKIILYTNGDFLTLALYKKLVAAGTDEFIITQHSKNINKEIKKIEEYVKLRPEDNVKVKYSKLDFINNRGGLIKSGKPIESHKCRVLDPQVVIDCQGNVILCCQDYLSSVKFGNIKDEKLLEIWKKPEYQKLRKNIRKGIFELLICKKCTGKVK